MEDSLSYHKKNNVFFPFPLVIILSVAGNRIRDFMLTAHSMGFTNGDYVFMDVELFKFEGKKQFDNEKLCFQQPK